MRFFFLVIFAVSCLVFGANGSTNKDESNNNNNLEMENFKVPLPKHAPPLFHKIIEKKPITIKEEKLIVIKEENPIISKEENPIITIKEVSESNNNQINTPLDSSKVPSKNENNENATKLPMPIKVKGPARRTLSNVLDYAKDNGVEILICTVAVGGIIYCSYQYGLAEIAKSSWNWYTRAICKLTGGLAENCPALSRAETLAAQKLENFVNSISSTTFSQMMVPSINYNRPKPSIQLENSNNPNQPKKSNSKSNQNKAKPHQNNQSKTRSRSTKRSKKSKKSKDNSKVVNKKSDRLESNSDDRINDF